MLTDDLRKRFPGIAECLDSELRDGVWDESLGVWLVLPAHEYREVNAGEFLVIGLPASGEAVGFRKGRSGLWILYHLEPRYASLTKTVRQYLHESRWGAV